MVNLLATTALLLLFTIIAELRGVAPDDLVHGRHPVLRKNAASNSFLSALENHHADDADVGSDLATISFASRRDSASHSADRRGCTGFLLAGRRRNNP